MTTIMAIARLLLKYGRLKSTAG